MAKKSPTINGGSMSDISFLLLTFFLLTSSMDTDTGIARKLPQMLPPDAPKPEIHDRNVFKVAINFRDELQVQGQLSDLSVLRDMAKDFLAELERFAAATPFELPGLLNASKRLLAFGFSAQQVIPILTAIGDSAAALGMGEDGINRLTTAIGQIQAKAKVSTDITVSPAPVTS